MGVLWETARVTIRYATDLEKTRILRKTDEPDPRSTIETIWKEGQGFQYRKTNGEPLMPDWYAAAGEFIDGQALVSFHRQDGWDACIDSHGHVLYTVKDLQDRRGYRYIDAYWAEGRRMVSLYPEDRVRKARDEEEIERGWFGFIDGAGQEIIPPCYTAALGFEKGRCVVARGTLVCGVPEAERDGTEIHWVKDEKWGVIDRDGQTVIPCEYDDVAPICGEAGLFAVCIGDPEEGGLWGVRDAEGAWIAEPQFGCIFGGDNEENNGKLIFQTEFWENDDARSGVYDLAQRKVIIEPLYTVIEWNNGCFSCTLPGPDGLDGDVVVYDEKGNRLFQIPDGEASCVGNNAFSIDTIEYGNGLSHPSQRLLDRRGNELFPAGFCDRLVPLYPPKDWEGLLAFYDGGQCGLIDVNGNIRLEPQYTALAGLPGGFLKAWKDGKWGVIDRDNRGILPFRYESIRSIGNAWICDDGQTKDVYVVEEK